MAKVVPKTDAGNALPEKQAALIDRLPVTAEPPLIGSIQSEGENK